MEEHAEPVNAQSPPQATELPAPLFISYASHDTALAQKLCAALESVGFRCWIAPRDVVPGMLYAEGIVRAINNSKLLVLVLSESAVASAHVGKEIERASSKRHPIIALRTDKAILPPAFEYFLNESQWIDVETDRADAAIAQLVNAVRRHLVPTVSDQRRESSIADRRSSHRRRWISIACIALIGLGLGFFAVNRTWIGTHVEAPSTTTAGVTAVTRKSVAVLPFADMSEHKDQEFFADGMSEELIDLLTKVPDLRVPARTSSFYYKGKQAKIADIAKELGVSYLLEGSVRKSDTVLRVTVQLVRADDGYHLWSQTYDRKLDDIFKIQDEIATGVVRSLEASLFNARTGTQDIDAYNLYLQARFIFYRADTKENYATAISLLQQALKADPKFAAAWAQLSVVFSVQGETGILPMDSAIKNARAAVKQALALDPTLPDAHTAMARIMVNNDYDLVGAEKHIEQALEVDPNNSLALAWAGSIAAYRGHFDKGIELLKQSINSDPVNFFRYGELAEALYYAGRYSEANNAIHRMLDINPTARVFGHIAEYSLLAQGNPAAAVAALDAESTDDLQARDCRVLAYDALGRKTEADAMLANLERDHSNDSAYEIGRIYANRGRLDEAFKWFDRSYRQRNDALSWVKVDPLLRNVQSDIRFATLITKIGLMN
jgi:TolB-like protein/Tfp pilus assembly protein PilF